MLWRGMCGDTAKGVYALARMVFCTDYRVIEHMKRSWYLNFDAGERKKRCFKNYCDRTASLNNARGHAVADIIPLIATFSSNFSQTNFHRGL